MIYDESAFATEGAQNVMASGITAIIMRYCLRNGERKLTTVSAVISTVSAKKLKM